MEKKDHTQELIDTAKKICTPGKGILAADESPGSIVKKFDALKLENTAENRRRYREMLLTAEGMENYISGVILQEETAKQADKNGKRFIEVLQAKGVVPGIKVNLPSNSGRQRTCCHLRLQGRELHQGTRQSTSHGQGTLRPGLPLCQVESCAEDRERVPHLPGHPRERLDLGQVRRYLPGERPRPHCWARNPLRRRALSRGVPENHREGVGGRLQGPAWQPRAVGGLPVEAQHGDLWIQAPQQGEEQRPGGGKEDRQSPLQNCPRCPRRHCGMLRILCSSSPAVCPKNRPPSFCRPWMPSLTLGDLGSSVSRSAEPSRTAPSRLGPEKTRPSRLARSPSWSALRPTLSPSWANTPALRTRLPMSPSSRRITNIDWVYESNKTV